MARTDEKIDKYLNERLPNKEDYKIVDIADALASEIEVSIEDIIARWDDFVDDVSWRDMDSSEQAKIINLAIKKINRNKVVRNCIPR